MISFKGELLRLNGNKLEYSTDGGKTFKLRRTLGVFKLEEDPVSIMANGDELLLTTKIKLLYSTDAGKTHFKHRKNL